MIDNYNDETNFTHKILLTNTQASRFCKAFVNTSLADIKLSKTQLSKIELSGILFFFRYTSRIINKKLFVFNKKMYLNQ